MNIKGIIENIFVSIANKLEFEIQKKRDIQINYTKNGLNPTAIGAGVIANIAIDDSDIVIDGNNARADAIRNIVDYFTDEIQTVAAEVSLGTGDCIIRPFTDGKYIGLNVIGNDNFVITESIGTHLKGVIIKMDEYKTNQCIYRLFESQTLKEGNETKIVHIRRFAYKDENEIDIASTSWRDMKTEETIVADQLLIGRYKCPTINRDDYNSANGVPITFGCEDLIKQVKESYNQYNDEFDRKKALIFADKTMFKNDDDSKNKNSSMGYKLSGREFFKVRGDMNNGVSDMIQDYSPAIREAEFQSANNFNLSVLELCCGFSRGVFTSPETAFATATEMKNSLKKTFAFVKRFRKRMEAGDKMLFNAINIIMNINGTTPMGEWDIRHDWSYDYIEETKERFNQLMQGHSAGVVKDETVCAWINGLSEEKAKKYMDELKAAAEPETEENSPTENDGIVFE